VDRNAKLAIFQNQLGKYVLDINRTLLRSYLKDSSKYQNLFITFKSDSTFIMNMKVPFMHDSIGTWIAGDGSSYEYNQLYYKNLSYAKEGTGEQFYPVFLQGKDSLFMLNSSTPQEGFEFIQEIYFKKINGNK